MPDPETSETDEPSLLDSHSDTSEDPDGEQYARIPRKDIRSLEKSAKEARAEARDANKLRRENALLKAGVDDSTDAGQMFAKAYDGELTTEAIQAEAAKITGALRETGQPAEEPEEPGAEENAELSRQRQELSRGAPPDNPPDQDPYEAAKGVFHQVIEDGRPEREAMGTAMNSLVNRAANGDSRVILGSDGRSQS